MDSDASSSTMSALGQKQTFCDAEAMSAFPKADIDWREWDVRFVPIAAHCQDKIKKKRSKGGRKPGKLDYEKIRD